MSSRSPNHATTVSERFISGRFARFVESLDTRSRARKPRTSSARSASVVLPSELARLLDVLDGRNVGDFAPTLPKATPQSFFARTALDATKTATWLAWLSGAIPFGKYRDGRVVAYFVAESPAYGVVATFDPSGEVEALTEGASSFAALHMALTRGRPTPKVVLRPGVRETVRSLSERAKALFLAWRGTIADMREAVRTLSAKPIDVPLTGASMSKRPGRSAKARRGARCDFDLLAFGAIVEAYLRLDDVTFDAHVAPHAESDDVLTQDLVRLLLRTLDAKSARRAAWAEATRKRRLAARRVARIPGRESARSGVDLAVTRAIALRIDAIAPFPDSTAATHEREETLLALGALGDRAIVPELRERAREGDAQAVTMLTALGDDGLLAHLGELGELPSRRFREFEIAMTRMLVATKARDSAWFLRETLRKNPIRGWRDGLERGQLVRELVWALGELGDHESAPALLTILGTSEHEYRSVLPAAAHALGRLGNVAAMAPLERLLASPKEQASCEAIWAAGEIARRSPETAPRITALLERLVGLEPGAEMTRLSALAKAASGRSAPKAALLRTAFDRALWEPAFRQEETSRRRAWAFRALEDLAIAAKTGARLDAGTLFLGHDAIRHFMTRDEHRVRQAAERAFAAWQWPTPSVRPYFSFVLDDMEATGGLDALLEAVRDPLGLFRHNVATRLAERSDPRAVRPIAEAVARAFAEPATSTYEYEDAPPYLVAFVRALARFNHPEGNEVLRLGLDSENLQVRAIVAEHVPRDPTFVPLLMNMLGDPRSFLRARAERSLRALGAIPVPSEPATIELPVIASRLEA